MNVTDLELGGFHGDGDTNEEDAEHSDGGVAFPVFGATIRTTGHTPNLVSEISVYLSMSMSMISSTSHRSD